MEVKMLVTRPFFHNFRLLLPLETAPEKQAKRRAQDLEQFLNKNPTKLTGRHIFLGDFVESAKEALGPGTVL
eukprot:11195459-Lingulodinium_polyedra.AAC.1